MSTHYDLAVLGAGPGGYVAALRGARHGLRTVLVEADDRLGGTCLLRGCIPTKALVHAAEIWRTCRKDARAFGITVGEATFDWAKVQKRRSLATTKGEKGVRLLMVNAGVTVVHGRGRLDGPGRLVVALADGGTEDITADKIVLATGSRPASVPGFEVDGDRILNSDHALQLDHVPASMVVLGAGAVGLELAAVMAAFGSKVTLVEMMDQVLPLEDPDAAAVVAKALGRQGVKIRTATRAIGVERTDTGVVCRLLDIAARSEETVEAECLLVAVGRRANTKDIGLDTVTVEQDRRGHVMTDSNMMTATEGLYAIGDIVPTQQLAHLASREALQAVDHAAGKPRSPIRYHQVPRCTYSHPEVASVGLTARQAEDEGRQVSVGTFDFAALGKASILNEPHGFSRVVADAETGEVLGVHLVGARVTELIAGAATALGMGADLHRWADVIHPHPTLSEAIHEAIHGALGEPLHGA